MVSRKDDAGKLKSILADEDVARKAAKIKGRYRGSSEGAAVPDAEFAYEL